MSINPGKSIHSVSAAIDPREGVVRRNRVHVHVHTGVLAEQIMWARIPSPEDGGVLKKKKNKIPRRLDLIGRTRLG